MDEHASALDVAAAIRNLDVSPLEVLEATLARIDARNPELNAVIWRNDDEARGEAAALGDRIAAGSDDLPPFAGVPLPIKDLLAVAGQPVTYGSQGAPSGVATVTEPVADAFRRAGFILTGRTNTPEFGSVTVTENRGSAPPATRGTTATRRAVRAGVPGRRWPGHVPRGPRQRRRRVDPDPGLVLRSGGPQAQSGPGGLPRPGMAGDDHRRGAHPDGGRQRRGPGCDQCPRPCRLVERTTPPAAVRRRGRGGPGPAAGGPVHGVGPRAPLGDGPVAAVEHAGRLLEAAGHRVTRLEADVFDPAGLGPFLHVVNSTAGEMEGIDWDRVEPHNQASREAAQELDSVTFVRSLSELKLMTRTIVARFDHEFDLLVTPTMAIEPPEVGLLETVHAGADTGMLPMEIVAMAAFTAVFNITGQPAVSLPLYVAPSGLPVGVQIVAGPWRESLLIRVASQLERAEPWIGRHPRSD